MSKENNRLNRFNEEVEQLRKTNGYALVGERFKEVIAEDNKNENYYRIKNWYR